MVDRVRFAVIGAGFFGGKRIDAIMRSSKAELVYVVDSNKDLRKLHGYGVDFLVFDDLLLKNDFDVAIVAVPNNLHEYFVCRLLEAGKDVWCEKPMSISIESAKRMVEKSVETGCVLKIGSNVRYFPNILRLQELLSRGLLGKGLFFRGWIGNEGMHLLSRSWYSKKDVIGGGTLLDNGVHLIDLIRFLIDEVVLCRACSCYNLRWRFEGLEDNALAIYEFMRGGFATIHSSWTERSGYMYFEIHGEKGYAHLDCRWSKAILTYSFGDGDIVREDYTHSTKLSYDAELEDFIDFYRRGLHPKPTSYDGYRAVKVVSLSYEVASTGKAVKVFDEDDMKLEEEFRKKFVVEKPHLW